MLSIDLRFNTGTTPKIEKKVVLCMLKNIQIMRKKKLIIKPEWLKMEVIKHEEIPTRIYKILKIADDDLIDQDPFGDT